LTASTQAGRGCRIIAPPAASVEGDRFEVDTQEPGDGLGLAAAKAVFRADGEALRNLLAHA